MEPARGGPLKFGIGFDTKIALDYLGDIQEDGNLFQYEGVLSDNTKEEYMALSWLDERAKPAFSTLQAVMPAARTWYYEKFYHLHWVNYVGESLKSLYDTVHQEIEDVELSPAEMQRASAVVNQYTCGETISALKAVYAVSEQVFLAGPTSMARASIVGIALTSGTEGTLIDVLQYGILEDESLGFRPTDLIFVGSNGTLTTTAPTAGYLTRVGRAINPSTAIIIIDSPKTL